MNELTFKLPGRALVKCLRWGNSTSAPIVVAISSEKQPADWSEFASRLDDAFQFIALPPYSPVADVLGTFGAVQTIIAHGAAGSEACSALAAEPALAKSIVLTEYVPPPGAAGHASLAVPVLVLRGRQCRTQNHQDAVRLHEAIPGSRLIEPEDCGDWAFGACPDAAAAAVRWFAASLSGPAPEAWIEFDVGPG